jgi:hypothetical protein
MVVNDVFSGHNRSNCSNNVTAVLQTFKFGILEGRDINQALTLHFFGYYINY